MSRTVLIRLCVKPKPETAGDWSDLGLTYLVESARCCRSTSRSSQLLAGAAFHVRGLTSRALKLSTLIIDQFGVRY